MTSGVEAYRNVAVPMRDGTILRADVYLPVERSEGLPALVSRTTYGKNGFLTTIADVGALVARGYAVVMQDKRGRFDSDGDYTLLRDDADGPRKDGFDTVEWVAAQPWSNGEVATFGLSYLGHTALGAAIAAPPHLVAAVAAQPSSDDFTDRAFTDGVFNLAGIAGWATTEVLAPSLIARLPEDHRADVSADLDEFHMKGVDQFAQLPLGDWPFLRRFPMLWSDILTHREDPEYFAENRLREAEAAQIEVPIRHVGGWFDFFTRNSVRHYEITSRLARSARPHQLVMGPWLHGNFVGEQIGEVSFPGSSTDFNAVVADWVDAITDGTGADDQPAAVIYVLGANRWRAEPVWPIPGTETLELSLAADGSLTVEDVSEGKRDFTYDPADPYCAPSVVGGMADLSAFAAGKNVLVYTSDPVTEALEITGWPRAVLSATTTGTDADWVVELHIVDPNGTPRIVNEGIARARYRHGVESPTAVTPGDEIQYDVALRPMSLELQPGERLRVIVSGGKFPAFERNPNTFVDLNAVTEADFHVATSTIHSGGEHGSKIELPVVPSSAHGRWIENPWPFTPVAPTPIAEVAGPLK